MRISDWSSDVCSSDLQLAEGVEIVAGRDGVEDHVEAAGVRRHLRGIARVDDLVGTQRAGAVALAFGGGEGDDMRAHRVRDLDPHMAEPAEDRKSTRLNSSH